MWRAPSKRKNEKSFILISLKCFAYIILLANAMSEDEQEREGNIVYKVIYAAWKIESSYFSRL